MWKLSKNHLISFGVFLLNILITHFFFEIHDYYSNEPIMFIDYPRFLHFAWYLGELLIPQFNSIFGFSESLYMGYPIIHIYPPGIFFIIYLIHLLGLEYAVSIKIILFGLLVFMGQFPFWAAKQYKISDIGGVFGVLWMWFGINSFWLNQIQQGLLPYYYAVLLSYMFLIKISKKDFSTHQRFITKDHFLGAFLIFGISLLNFMALLFLAFVCGAELLLLILKEKKISKTMKNWLLFYIEIVIIAFLFLGFWILPTLFIQFSYVAFDQTAPIFSFSYSYQSIIDYAKNNNIALIGMGILIVLLNYTKPIDKDVQYISQIATFSIIIVTILPLISLNYFSGINTYRFLIYFELSISILICFFYDFVKKFFNKFRSLDASERINSMIKKKLSKKILINVICIGFLVANLFFLNNPNNSFRGPFLGQFRTSNGTIIDNSKINNKLNAEDQNLIDWIKNNTDKESRILIQNSGDNSGFMHSNSHSLGYLALLTDRYYANGDIDHFWYKYSLNVSFTDDILYGKNLLDIPASDLFSYFDLYNIQFIIIWSPIAKNYFNVLCQTFNEIVFVQDSGDFRYYRYIKPYYSYVLVDSNTKIDNFSMNDTRISFVGKDFKEFEEVIVSIHDFVNWQIFINETQIEKEINCMGLIQFKIPNQFRTNANVSIVWKKTALEYVSDSISIVSFTGYLGLLLLLYIQKVKRSK